MKGYLSDETCCVLTKPQQEDEKLIRRFTLDSSNLIVLVDRSLVYITGNKNKDANNIISKKLWSKGLYILSYVYSYGYFDEEKNSIDYYSIAKDFQLVTLIGLSVLLSYLYIKLYKPYLTYVTRIKKIYSSDYEEEEEKTKPAEKKKVGRPNRRQK